MFSIFVFLLALLPTHDFHTSWMNFTYDEKKHELIGEWRTDTEHLEATIAKRINQEDFKLSDTMVQVPYGLALYLSEHLKLKINGKPIALQIAQLEVNFAETTIHFKPIKKRCNIKSVTMKNTLLTSQFPNQQNMFQLNYKGKMYSLLFSSINTEQSLAVDKSI
ncbi:MAG: hypothetical protein RLZZ337_1067 [Bacteroidota bacterium]